MTQIVVIGCGVVGAAIAYELSLIPGLSVIVIDKALPATGSTGAALGVLMGAIAHKVKGRLWKMRKTSLDRYNTLIPELEALTGCKIPYNRQGILKLVFSGEDLDTWVSLAAKRHEQGMDLQIWGVDRLKERCPQLNCQQIQAGIYSRCDRQVDPVALVQALIIGGRKRGVKYEFETDIEIDKDSSTVKTQSNFIKWDYLIISAGLGSAELGYDLKHPLPMEPVLGQGMQIQLLETLGNPDFQPVITADDVHIVPASDLAYYVGATVEFPQDGVPAQPDAAELETIRQKAIALCPQLGAGKILRSWSGLRPRPVGQPAPVIRQHPERNDIIFATGHYRNGILLAPATAIMVRDTIIAEADTNC